MWDWTLPMLQRDPSKNASRKFGQYLHAVNLPDPALVFHSFRRTVVSVMQDAQVPLSHAMQIVGHEAQAHAVRTGRISEREARSVHLKVYTHADLERMGTEYPILPLKDALERSVKPPLDYRGLRAAADIVLAHVRKVGQKFEAGWPTRRKRQTEKQIALLRKRMA